jgi:hypothetical protein
MGPTEVDKGTRSCTPPNGGSPELCARGKRLNTARRVT